jgi:hypothetical protein
MVRYEAAEALGGIATSQVLLHLKEWVARDDAPVVVRESCQVALDMWEVSTTLIGKTITNVVRSTKTLVNSSMRMV